MTNLVTLLEPLASGWRASRQLATNDLPDPFGNGFYDQYSICQLVPEVEYAAYVKSPFTPILKLFDRPSGVLLTDNASGTMDPLLLFIHAPTRHLQSSVTSAETNATGSYR